VKGVFWYSGNEGFTVCFLRRK